MLWGWALIFIATIHLTFLPSILPYVLKGFDLTGEKALKSAGFIMMGYTATALIGNYFISRLTPKAKLKGVIAVLCLTSAFLQLLLFFPGGVIGFATIRMLQAGVIAAVIPMTMANFASELGGTGIGFLKLGALCRKRLRSPAGDLGRGRFKPPPPLLNHCRINHGLRPGLSDHRPEEKGGEDPAFQGGRETYNVKI